MGGHEKDLVLGVDTEDEELEPEDLDEEKEPEEAIAGERRRLEPLPSAEEQRKHRLTHLPFRSWCPHCVAAAANDDPPPIEEVRQAIVPGSAGSSLGLLLSARCW